jgi:hypothetical protein
MLDSDWFILVPREVFFLNNGRPLPFNVSRSITVEYNIVYFTMQTQYAPKHRREYFDFSSLGR